MSTVGPLTTVFTPSPACATNAGYTELTNEGGDSFVVKGPLTTEGCYPSGFKTDSGYYYDPGQCPSGYMMGCFAAKDAGSVIVTSGYCCPELETGAFRCEVAGASNTALPTGFPCMNVITNTTTVLAVTKVSAGSTVTGTSTLTNATIGAYGIPIMFRKGDKLEQPPDPERFNKVRLTFSNHTVAGDHGLSPEAKAGVGVGVCLAAGLIALGFVLFLRRIKASRREKSVGNYSILSTPTMSNSPSAIRRKPVPSVHSHAGSFGVPNGEKGYHTVNSDDIQHVTHGDVTGNRDHRSRYGFGISLWAWETLALFTSALSLVSMIIILDVYDNRQLDEWKPAVSINAVISILSAIFKGSLAVPITEGISQLKWLAFAKRPRTLSNLNLYDNASRGAWGSVTMIFGLFKSESRAYLASIGAAFALILLATDPFAQATVSLYSCVRNGTDVATIPRANNFSVGGDLFARNPLYSDAFNTAMQLAAYRGILEPPANSSASVIFSCATGNCTFPETQGTTFTSLTMCSAAWDITERVQIEDTDNGYIYSLGSDNTVHGRQLINTSYVADPEVTSFKESDDSPWNRTSVLDVYVLSMVQDNSTNCEMPSCIHYYGYEVNFKPSGFVFSLFPCLQTFSANVVDGQYSETISSEEYLHYISPLEAGIYQLPVNQTMINGTWVECTSTEKPNETNTIPTLLEPLDSDSSKAPSLAWYPPECVFQFAGGYYLGDSLGSTFFNTENLPSAATWKNKLWRNGTTDIDLVSDFAKGLAISLGAHMRTNGVGPDMLREARGTTQVVKTCIRIHWGYIAFFAAKFVFGLLFLVIVAVLGFRSKLHADWKSSSLAVAYLSAGKSRRAEWAAHKPESESNLQEAAKTVKVSLINESGFWHLRTENKS